MLSRAEARLLHALARRRRRDDEGLFLAEGVRVVEELLDAGVVLRFAVTSSALEDTARGRALAGRLADAAPVRQVPPAELDGLAATRTPQGALVVAERPRADLSTIRPAAASAVLVLDGVQDPGNIGTLSRTAVAFGCGLVACLPGTVDPWNPKAVRSSAGALFRIPVATGDPEALWRWLDEHAFTVLGAEAGGEAIGMDPPRGRRALVVGNEGAGLRDEVRARCHRLVSVPMRGPAESLNVAVAAGILLYELTRGLG